MYGNFDEKAQETWDFVRCQRANGTFYGTAGKCRKGDETGAKEKAAPKPKKPAKVKKALAKATPEQLEKVKKDPRVTPEQKKVIESAIAEKTKSQGEGYTPRERGETAKPGIFQKITSKVKGKREDDTDNIGFKDKNQINKMFDDRRQTLQNNTKDSKNLEKNLADNEVRRERALKAHETNKKFAADLKAEMPKGFTARVDEFNGAILLEKKVGKNTLQVEYSPTVGINYRVNDSYNVGSVKDRKEQLQIATSVRDAWDAIVRASPEGQRFYTSAYDGDGQEAKRIKAYKRIGFGEPAKGNEMFAVKRGGKIIPLGKDEAEATEKIVDFAEDEMTRAWMEVIFPGEEKE